MGTKGTRTSTVPKDESKRDKFKRLVNKRTVKVLTGMQSIGKLATPSYEFTEEDVKKVTSALAEGLKQLLNAFSKSPKKTIEFDVEAESKPEIE